MNELGEGVAFASLVAAAVALEYGGYRSDGVWLLIVVWALFFGKKPGGE